MSDGHLFSKESLGAYLGNKLSEAKQTIEQWNQDELLQLPDQDVIDYVMAKFDVDCPVVYRAGIEALPLSDTTVRVSDGWGEHMHRRVAVRRYVAPFTGDPEVFKYMATIRTYNPPDGTVRALTTASGELEFGIQHGYGEVPEPKQLEHHVHQIIDTVDRHLTWSEVDLRGYKAQLAQIAGSVGARKAAILRERELEANLGFPVRGREDSGSYAVPVTRKTMVAKPTVPQTLGHKPFKPEPALSDALYEEAIEVLINGRNSLERSPNTVARFSETSIRDNLLLNLNARFEGNANGEVFNGAGKTDILIREGDRNVFIAECKIWKGQKGVSDALDQLLGYLVWRDTKAALLLFIRRGNATDAISKAIEAIDAHPSCKRTIRTDLAGGRSDFIISSKEDEAREIQLAFLPFVLPVKA